MSMKVSLIVVQGKPEGKVIPLVAPCFRIGRGEGCHLRPNNEQVSRNHAEIEQTDAGVVVRDLGSRNGTFLNNQKIEPNTDRALKNKDLVQVGPLTFAISIQGAEAAAAGAGPQDKSDRAMTKAASLDELSHDDIDSWLVTDKDSPAPPERPSGVYTGDTMTFSSYQEASKSDHQVPAQAKAEPEAHAPPESVDAAEVEDDEEQEIEEDEEADDETEDENAESDDLIYDKLDDDAEGAEDEQVEELVDESNPFFIPKKEGEGEPDQAAAKKTDDQDSSRAAEDILRKMMERRRAPR